VVEAQAEEELAEFDGFPGRRRRRKGLINQWR